MLCDNMTFVDSSFCDAPITEGHSPLDGTPIHLLCVCSTAFINHCLEFNKLLFMYNGCSCMNENKTNKQTNEETHKLLSTFPAEFCEKNHMHITRVEFCNFKAVSYQLEHRYCMVAI